MSKKHMTTRQSRYPFILKDFKDLASVQGLFRFDKRIETSVIEESPISCLVYADNVGASIKYPLSGTSIEVHIYDKHEEKIIARHKAHVRNVDIPYLPLNKCGYVKLNHKAASQLFPQ